MEGKVLSSANRFNHLIIIDTLLLISSLIKNCLSTTLQILIIIYRISCICKLRVENYSPQLACTISRRFRFFSIKPPKAFSKVRISESENLIAIHRVRSIEYNACQCLSAERHNYVVEYCEKAKARKRKHKTRLKKRREERRGERGAGAVEKRYPDPATYGRTRELYF